MDLVSSCKDKLGYFRVKELKDVLTQLGIGKQGRKQDFMDRILAALTDDQVTKSKKNSIGKEGIAKIIEDTYRKMQTSGATDLASKGQSDSSFDNAKIKDEVVDSRKIDIKVQCPCGSSLQTESMIQCQDPQCQVWQHIGCVVIPERPAEGVPPIPPQFYCEICRINRADPFWMTVTYPLPPIKLTTLSIPTDGTNLMQNVEKTFQLTRADIDMVHKSEYDVQAWCMLLNDKVIFRMHWPLFSDLQVNGVPIRSINRPGSQSLGANGRDDGPAITTCTREGMNTISLTRCDVRIFCVGVRIAKRRTVQQVFNLIPKELDGERFEDAHARVCRCIGGGNDVENADSDSDLEVVADSVTVNLRCPMSGSRIKIAGRFKPCIHMGSFDLDTFVDLNQRSRKWQCPICLKNYTLEHMIIDPYFNRITAMMGRCGEDVTEIDVKPDGSWRAKNEKEHLDLAQWHFPDGSLCVETGKNVEPDLENSKQIKHDGPLEGQNLFKLGIKKNSNGAWEVKKPELLSLSPESRLEEKYDIHSGGGILRSSSATGSGRDVEDRNANRDAGGHFDFLANNDNVPSAPARNADIIILSDSDEEMENLISHGAVFETGQSNACGTSLSVPSPGVPVSYHEDPGLITDSALDLLNSNGDEFEMPLWPSVACCTHAGLGFQFFGIETDVSDSLEDVQRTSINCSTSTDGSFSLAPDTTLGSAKQISDSICHSNTHINGVLIDNPLTIGDDDPSLQIFLPTHPTASSAPTDVRDPPGSRNCIREEDWISLRVGDGVGHDWSAATNGLNAGHQSVSKEASLLPSSNDERSDRTTTSQQKYASHFSFPRQPRSVRPRLYLSIDSDSD